MTLSFVKYQGTGNDFVLIDDRNETFPDTNQALIERICHRRFGIGADGLILLRNDSGHERPGHERPGHERPGHERPGHERPGHERPGHERPGHERPGHERPGHERPGHERPDYTFRMVYFNADGAEGSMCGNGGRCIVRFAHDLGLFDSETRFQAVDGEHIAVVCEEDIFLKMSTVTGIEDRDGLIFLNTGSPHVVQFVDDLESLDVVAEGRAIRYNSVFSPGGTNVNFAQVLDDNTVFVRTYERGVEDETYSCGTGVTAVALAAHRHRGMSDPVFIQTIGGNLRVSFNALTDGSFDNIYLIGPAKRVFAGTITV